MTLNELRYIVAVARERHFGRAADTCYVSQPTLSVAVKKLEHELGVGLFERGQGEVSVTPAGEPIVSQAQRVIEEAARIRQLASQSKDQLSGPLRVGAIHTVGPYLFPNLVSALNERAPQMPLVIREHLTAVLTEQLKRGEQDVIIVSLPYVEPGIETRTLYDEPFSVLLPTGHPLADQASIATEQLQDENVLLLGDGHCLRDQILAFCPGCVQGNAHEENLQRNLEGCSLETIRCMVASGLGITVLPHSAIDRPGVPGEMLMTRPFSDETPGRRVALAWRRSFPRPDAVALLWQVIRDSIRAGVVLVEEMPLESAVHTTRSLPPSTGI
ncbi:MAG: hydrogen peroxide-inducible genes activator [Gammaproteobacteria bacterium]|nr:hydrogen peroxide-inducible genes activator [Gammaproteobacteria bacterium]